MFDQDQGLPRSVAGNDNMVLLRGIVFFLLLVAVTLVSTAGAESFASTAPATGAPAGVTHIVMNPTAADHCKTMAASDRYGGSHDGCCRDMNCGVCAQSGVSSLPLIDSPALVLVVHANAISVKSMVGRNIAPETGPPKSPA